MPCQVTISDGTDTAVFDISMSQFSLAFDQVAGGDAILRFLDGSAAKQTRWKKKALTLSCADDAPSGLLDLDYSENNANGGNLDVTVQRGSDSYAFTCVSLGPQESWDYKQGEASWTMVLEEA